MMNWMTHEKLMTCFFLNMYFLHDSVVSVLSFQIQDSVQNVELAIKYLVRQRIPSLLINPSLSFSLSFFLRLMCPDWEYFLPVAKNVAN